jgi:hypothetical protein
MLAPITAQTILVDSENGSTIEYSHDLLEEHRRLAVAGFVAFRRGRLEIAGVLYGLRDRTCLTIHRSVEFASTLVDRGFYFPKRGSEREFDR